MLVEQPGERGGDFPDIAVEVLTLVDPICWAESTLPNQPARSIDVFAITDMQNQDDQPSVFNLVDYPEVPNADAVFVVAVCKLLNAGRSRVVSKRVDLICDSGLRLSGQPLQGFGG